MTLSVQNREILEAYNVEELNGAVVMSVERLASVMDAARSESESKVENLEATVEHYEAMRPHWAQGFTDDGIAAQTQSIALSALWKILGVNDQTAAVLKLQELVK